MAKAATTTKNITQEVVTNSAPATPARNAQTFHFSGLTKRSLETAIELDIPTLLVGETGVGKTSAIRYLAQENGKNLIRLSLTGQTGVDEILGKYIITPHAGMTWIDGPLVDAMKKGDWIVFDEINMAQSEILSVLHPLLDDDKMIMLKECSGEVIRPAEGFRFFATMNPTDEYTGTKELNKAFMSRFGIILDIGYSDNEHEIVIEQSGVDEDSAKVLVQVASNLRETKAKNDISLACSTRDLIASAILIKQGFKMSEAMELSVVNKAHPDERNAIRKVVELVTGDKLITFKSSRTGKGMSFKSVEEMKKQFEELEKKQEDAENRAQHYEKSFNQAQDSLRQRDDKVFKAKRILDEMRPLVVTLGDKSITRARGESVLQRMAQLLQEANAQIN